MTNVNSDTPTNSDELRKLIHGVHEMGLRLGEDTYEPMLPHKTSPLFDSFDKAEQAFQALINNQVREVLERLQDNGHGGGNYRRLIHQELSKLEEKNKMSKSEEEIAKMVNRFLAWEIPADFQPDAGISYEPLPSHHPKPTGTNLLTATQAEEMVRYMLKENPNE